MIAKNAMESSLNGSSGMSAGRIEKPSVPSSDGTKQAHPSP